MKILMCAANYPPLVGGVPTLSARLAGALAVRGHDVRVLARHPRGCGADPRIDEETKPAKTIRVGWKPLLYPVYAAAALATRPDVVLLTCRADFLRPALGMRGLAGAPVAVIVHGNEVWWQGGRRREGILGALSRADRLVAVSRYVKERLVALGLPAGKITLIQNGVSVESFDRADSGRRVRERFGLSGRKVVLSVGRLDRVKGFDTMIRALPEVARRLGDVAYLIVGGGREEVALRALAAECGVGERVMFAGEVPHGEMGGGAHAYYQACDLFVMPSRDLPETSSTETFGIAYLEAGACGKAVIGGRTGGAGEAVLEGETGLLADGDDPEALAACVVELLGDAERRRVMGEAGRRNAERRSWRHVAGTYEAMLREMARPEK